LAPACCLSREDGPASVLRSGAFMAVNSILPRVRGGVAQDAEFSAFRGPDQPWEEAFDEIGHEVRVGAKCRRALGPSPPLPGSAMRVERAGVTDDLNVLFAGARFLVEGKNFWSQSGVRLRFWRRSQRLSRSALSGVPGASVPRCPSQGALSSTVWHGSGGMEPLSRPPGAVCQTGKSRVSGGAFRGEEGWPFAQA
jgi:hypothetical protein